MGKMKSRTWNMWEHRGWGNRISWLDYDCREISGHISNPRIEMGDKIACQMQSGRTALFRIIHLKYERNPPDMFFATVQDI